MTKSLNPGQKKSAAIDWDEIKSRMASLQKVIEQKETLLQEEKRSLLKQRARALASREKDDTAQRGSIELVVFRLGYEIYGIETAFVREVYPLKDFTPLPGTPSFVLGIINVRGQIVSVIDLETFFTLPHKGLGELNKVIIMCNERMEFGILADGVEGTRSVARDEILAVPPSVRGIDEKFLKGVTKEHIVLLKAESILNDQSMIVNDRAR